MDKSKISLELPDEYGRFGQFGGVFVSETLMSALEDLAEVYETLSKDPEFQAAFDKDLAHYVGRPLSIIFCRTPNRKSGWC